MRKSISIVVINLNNERGLRATLDSIVQQLLFADMYPLIEVHVVDGLSTDSSVSVAMEFANKNPSIRVVSEADAGVYDAMNKGISRSNGDYLLFMNSGDRFGDSSALRVISAELETNPVWLIVGATNLGGGTREASVIRNLPHSWFRHVMGTQPHCHQACIFRRDLVTALDGYSLGFGLVGDFDFIVRSGIVAQPKEIPQLLVEYEGGGLSEHAWRSLPELQHRVRVEVLNLPRPFVAIDRLWVQYLIARRSFSNRKAKIRRPVLGTTILSLRSRSSGAHVSNTSQS